MTIIKQQTSKTPSFITNRRTWTPIEIKRLIVQQACINRDYVLSLFCIRYAPLPKWFIDAISTLQIKRHISCLLPYYEPHFVKDVCLARYLTLRTLTLMKRSINWSATYIYHFFVFYQTIYVLYGCFSGIAIHCIWFIQRPVIALNIMNIL